MKIKQILLTGTAWLYFLFFVFGQTTQKADNILGTWLTENKDGKFEIYKVGNKYFGKLIWGRTMYEADGITSKKDDKNPDLKSRLRNLKDLVMLTDFVFEDGIWNQGKIYNPEDGKTYSSTIKLENNLLKLRGYIGISLFGKTTTWSRMK